MAGKLKIRALYTGCILLGIFIGLYSALTLTVKTSCVPDARSDGGFDCGPGEGIVGLVILAVTVPVGAISGLAVAHVVRKKVIER